MAVVYGVSSAIGAYDQPLGINQRQFQYLINLEESFGQLLPATEKEVYLMLYWIFC